MPALESLESSLVSAETFVRWAALFAACFTALAAGGGVRLWLLQRAVRPLREEAKRVSEERVSVLQSQIAEANARAAEANEKAESERLARMKIEEKLAPRRISGEQRKSIAARMSSLAHLRGTSIRQDVAVFAVSAAFEAIELAEQIAAILGDAGWNISRHPVTFGRHLAVSGVGLLTSSNQRGVAVASSLAEVLNEAGIFTFVLPEKRPGCEEQHMEAEKLNATPWCSQVSVMVGDHP